MSSYHLLRAYCVLGSWLYTCDLILTLQNPASRHQFALFYSEEIEAQMRKWLAQVCTASMWLNWGCNWALFCPWSSSSFHRGLGRSPWLGFFKTEDWFPLSFPIPCLPSPLWGQLWSNQGFPVARERWNCWGLSGQGSASEFNSFLNPTCATCQAVTKPLTHFFCDPRSPAQMKCALPGSRPPASIRAWYHGCTFECLTWYAEAPFGVIFHAVHNQRSSVPFAGRCVGRFIYFISNFCLVSKQML